MSSTGQTIRIANTLFDELVRLATPISEAEHLSTLAGKTGEVIDYAPMDRPEWNLVRFADVPGALWIPAVCCIEEPEPPTE